MSDIFVSYASQERDRVLQLVSALERTGWSIFWDRTIPAGKTWRQVIGSEIRTCRSVLVVWTESSITSEWVLEEAETGKRRQILIPVLLDNVEPPFGFGNIQAANLTAWNGDSSSPNFTHLVADIATILGPAPTAVKEVEERRRLEAEAQRKAEEEGLQEQERQRLAEEARRKAEEENRKRIEEEENRARQEAEAQRKAEEERLQEQERQRLAEEARRKAEEEKRRRIEQEANRARPLEEKQIPSEVERARKESPAAPQDARERQNVSVPERRTRSDRRRLYTGGAVTIAIAMAAAITLWFLGMVGTKDADVRKIVSLGIQGKRQLNIGEKTILRVRGIFSDGSETTVAKNLDWHSSENSVVEVSQDGQVEARKDGYTDITVRYEGIASPPLTLVVRGESRSAETDAARLASKVQEYIKTAGSYRDRGEYSPALAELAKAKSLDPTNKALQGELENTTKACLAEQRIVLTNLRCE